MNKYIKQLALMIPQVKRVHENINQMRLQIDSLNRQLGFKEHIIDKLEEEHNNIVEAVWDEKSDRRQWVCTRPFTTMRIENSGDVATCCLAYIMQTNRPYFIGNAFTDSFDDIWNSDKVKKLRYSVAHGNFEYCTKYCPVLSNPRLCPDVMLPRKMAGYKYDKWQDCHLDKAPSQIHLLIDNSCNLHCFQCRNQVISKSAAEKEKITQILEKLIRPALKDCDILYMDGTGEFLVSEPHLQFLGTLSKVETPLLILQFISNGILFTPARWDKFSNLKGMRIHLSISVDAATKETYEKYRREGKWGILNENMEYISSLRNAGEIEKLHLSFVVHKGNFKEMESFIDLSKKWSVDAVYFQRLDHYGTFPSHEAFVEQDVFSVKNPLRNEATAILLKLLHSTSGIKVFQNSCLN